MQQESHITLSMEQFNLLMGEIRDLKNKLANVEAKTDNIHRIFNQESEESIKELTQEQKIEAEIKRQIDAENLEIIKKISRN